MKNILIGFVFSLFTIAGFAQMKLNVTGTTDPNASKINANAVLELSATDRGLLLPRVSLVSTTSAAPLKAHVLGMTVFNTVKQNDVVIGFYYNDGIKWKQMITTDYKAVKFFYMPTIIFDASVITPANVTLEKDLYTEYKKQFALEGKSFKSASAPGSAQGGIPYFTNATDLYYYITDYDDTVFQLIELSDNGILKYKIIKEATEGALINIVFVVK